MSYEVDISGGAPWGFRLTGGTPTGSLCTISRITPGGKAAQANVVQGDVLVAVNQQMTNGLKLSDIMKLIKNSREHLHLTLLTRQEDVVESRQKRHSEVNITLATEVERPPSNIPSLSPPKIDSQRPAVLQHTTQEHRTLISPCGEGLAEIEDDGNGQTFNTQKISLENYPDCVRRHLKPQKPLPDLKPEVHWLHGKLRIDMKAKPNTLSDPGNKLKNAAQAHPNQPIEIEGPLTATVVHAQYNTPVGLYSGSQIVNALVGTATAKGTRISDPAMFSNGMVDVNKETPVYKFVHQKEGFSPAAPAQSRSIQILDALLALPNAKSDTHA